MHEACEEWEQFERKLKEVKLFVEKSKCAIESTVNKKRTLREQHDLREKMLADITIQKKKITLSTEKLQVSTYLRTYYARYYTKILNKILVDFLCNSSNVTVKFKSFLLLI